MKKIICAILCLSIVLTGMIGITAASAETIPVKIWRSGSYAEAMTLGGASGMPGYYTYLSIYLCATFKRGAGMSDAGSRYDVVGSEAISWPNIGFEPCISTKVYAKNNADECVSAYGTGYRNWVPMY